MGPLIDEAATSDYLNAIKLAIDEGGELLFGGNVLDKDGFYVEPTIIKVKSDFKIIKEETFAPILYVMEYDSLNEAIEIHNNVPQGLSSAIFTNSIKNSERFLSARGSDCGIANVNIGTSGAEIGRRFWRRERNRGGRESGSDAWKAYMRRQTNTINWSSDLPLAQGIKFEL